MYRVLLVTILLILFIRAMSRLWNGIAVGMHGQPPGASHVPQRGVQMARDPICGTFVVPGRSVAFQSGSELLHFCSTACRDQYIAQGASRSGRGAAQGRPA